MVDTFLRGFEKGPRYGPQLHELNHDCKSNGSMSLHEGGYIDKSLDARVVRGKLLLHGIYKLSIPLPPQISDTLTSQVDISQIVSERLVPAIDMVKIIGCAHAQNTLPAVILDSFELRVGCSDDWTRSLDLLNCGHCATDLRVRVELDCSNACVQVEVEIWQSFGGRESDNRDETEDAHFCYGYKRVEPFDISHLPDRNRGDMFTGGDEGECGVLGSQVQSRRRQSCIQLWKWYYNLRTAQLRRYCVPYNGEGMSARIQEQALPLQCSTQ